jgi:hypothetical protein
VSDSVNVNGVGPRASFSIYLLYTYFSIQSSQSKDINVKAQRQRVAPAGKTPNSAFEELFSVFLKGFNELLGQHQLCLEMVQLKLNDMCLCVFVGLIMIFERKKYIFV